MGIAERSYEMAEIISSIIILLLFFGILILISRNTHEKNTDQGFPYSRDKEKE